MTCGIYGEAGSGRAMHKASLLRRILPPLAGAVVILTLITTLVGVWFMRNAVLARARTRAIGLSAIQTESLERLMRYGQHDDLQSLVGQLRRHPDVAAVRIIRNTGVVGASSVRSEVGLPAGAHAGQVRADGDLISSALAGAPGAPNAVHTIQPLQNRAECRSCHAQAGAVIGFLDLDVAVNPHIVGLTTFTSLSALLGLFYLVAVVGVAGPLIGAVAGRPVRRLIAAMQRVEAGELSTRLEPTGTREIDAVFAGFNHMSERLRQGRAAEDEARRLQLERVEHLASVGELAAGLAHEIRNPLSGVKAVIEVVARDTADPSRRSVLRDAAGELSRIDQIVRELLQYARPKKPVLTAFDLNVLVREAATLARPAASRQSEHTRCDLASSLPAVLGDAAQVRQVLINLLLNAEQAAGPEGLVTITTGRADGAVWCRVRDSGPGVAADRAEAVFRPFVTTKARGTGLGLSISHRIIELHGGRLTLDNPGEAGASFTFTLPIAPASGEPCPSTGS